MNIKPGDIVYLEPEEIDKIKTIKELKEIDTACVLVKLSNGLFGFIPIRGAYLAKEQTVWIWDLYGKTNYYPTQEAAIEASLDNYNKRWNELLEDVARVRDLFKEWNKK